MVRDAIRRLQVPDIIKLVDNVRSHLRLAAIAGVAVMLGIVACSPSKPPTRAVVKDTSRRKHAPDFALKDANGKLVHLTDYQGKVVLLDFWATWCGPCKVEIPWFMEFQRKYKDRGFEVVGVSMDDDGWKTITPYVEQKKINYRVVLGDDKTGDQYGGLEALPTTFVIDRNGRIASIHVGLTDKKDFSDAIEKLLEDPALPAGGNSVRSDGADAHHRAGNHG
jgi:peroxiredoxin